MRVPVGFDAVVEQAREHPVVLLTGPRGIGKRTCAEYLVHTSGAVLAERVIEPRLDMQAARRIIERCRTSPIQGIRAVALNVEAVSPNAANALLKTLEEPPPNTSFYLHASSHVPATITSRALTLHHGTLTDDQVYEVCRLHGMEDEQAAVAAHLAKGIPAKALTMPHLLDKRHVVSELLRAVAQGDHNLLSSATGSLDHDGLDLLRLWAHEAYTGRWAVFAPGEASGMEEDYPFVTRVLNYTERAGSPRLVARAALALPTEQRAGRVSA